jgi:hypothetical protein
MSVKPAIDRSAGRLARGDDQPADGRSSSRSTALADARRRAQVQRSLRPDDDEAAVLADMREGLVARGEPADDYTDDELRYALRVTLLALAIEYGGESAPQEPQ